MENEAQVRVIVTETNHVQLALQHIKDRHGAEHLGSREILLHDECLRDGEHD